MTRRIRKTDVMFALPAAGAGYALVSGVSGVSATCGDHIRSYAHAVDPGTAAAQADSHASLLYSPEGVTLFMQAVVHVGFVTSKAGGVPALTAQCLDHLKQSLTLLFSRQFGAR